VKAVQHTAKGDFEGLRWVFHGKGTGCGVRVQRLYVSFQTLRVFNAKGTAGVQRLYVGFFLSLFQRLYVSLRVEFLLKTDSGYPKDTGVNKPWQPLGIPFAITPIGQLLSFFCSSRGCTCLSFTLSFFDVENERIFLSSFDVEN